MAIRNGGCVFEFEFFFVPPCLTLNSFKNNFGRNGSVDNEFFIILQCLVPVHTHRVNFYHPSRVR
jgi:hypothetical protein